LDPKGVDVLVLAGDITMARHYSNLESVFKPLARKYRHILYVSGNHEYYKSSPKEVARNLAKLTKQLPEVVIPENETVWIHGHSHDRCDYRIGKTRVVANPLGYPNEVASMEAFEPAFTVEV
jgi:predicted phosphodiesterase